MFRFFKEKPPRGLYVEGQPKIICPTKNQIRAINKLPQAEYVSELADSQETMTTTDYSPEAAFEAYVERPLKSILLTDPMVSKMPRESLAIRGTACSVEGPLIFRRGNNTLGVRSLEQILRTGTDSGEGTTGLAPVDNLDGFPLMYLRYYPWNFRLYGSLYSGQNRDEIPIFPLLLVYNTARMQFDRRTSRYTVPTGTARSEVILRAFVGDYSVDSMI